MSCVFYNLDVDQGATFNINIEAKDQYLNPINLSGYACRSKIRESFSASGSLLDLTPTIYNYESGLINFIIPASGTAALPCNQYCYDLEVYSSNDEDVIKLLRGYVEVWPEATY